MAHVLRRRALYSPHAGDTLATIAANQCPAGAGLTWEDVAEFNWGTREHLEVNRMLAETVGCNRPVDAGNAGNTVLNPAKGLPGQQLAIPEPWTAPNLASDKTHRITVKRVLPPPAVSITRLDKWFIPKAQECRIDYNLEGIPERANRVDVEVFASNYCSIQATADGAFDTLAYTNIPTLTVPLVQRERKTKSTPRPATPYEMRSWKGRCEPAKGALKPRDGGTRYLNVAHSPYTVLVRFCKVEEDLKARLSIDPFWPRFDALNAPVTASLAVRWQTKDCSKMVHGQLIITDKDGNEISHKALRAGDFTDGLHIYDWNADVTANGIAVAPAAMPYRVQIQGHTNIFEDDGLAIAAMHTEVRLFAHQDNGTLPDPFNETSSLKTSLAPFLPVRTLAKPDADELPPEGSFRWYKLKLAEAGFHPGPCHDEATNEHFERGLKEFQRSVPKNTAAPFKRFKADGRRDSAVVTRLSSVPAALQRGLLGSTNDQRDYTLSQAKRRISDPTRELIVWVDDRHYFTQLDFKLKYKKMALDDYRAGMGAGDNKTTLDAACIPRPWLPLQATPFLLDRDSELYPNAVPNPDKDTREAMRLAIGPIRMDWSFIDVIEDYNIINAARPAWDYGTAGANKLNNAYAYDVNYYRPRRYIRDNIETLKAAHGGRDRTNAPVAAGGIRPTAIADYYRAALGMGDDSLLPWKATDGGAVVERVYSVIHDDAGQDKARVYPTHIGWAGIYLRPSLIAGDGYRVRAQVSFAAPQGGQPSHPNRQALEDRYPKLPHGFTAALRVWRKDSFRAHTAWSPPAENHWNNWQAPAKAIYQPAYMHFIHESGAPQDIAVNTLIAQDEFRKVITDAVVRANKAQKKAGGAAAGIAKRFANLEKLKKQIVLDPQRLWPYSQVPHFGIHAIPAAVTLANWEDEMNTFLEDDVQDRSWRAFRDALLMALLAGVEKSQGWLRGHFLTEFNSSPNFRGRLYVCDDCTTYHPLIETTAGDNTGIGEECRDPDCDGHLRRVVDATLTCPTSGAHNQNLVGVDETSVATTCPTCNAAYVRNIDAAPYIKNMGNMPFNASASSLGATWLFSDAGAPDTWSHEMGHHHHMEHAAGASGAVDAHHDMGANANVAGGQPQPNWARHCLMGYLKSGRPRIYCGKCLLKVRGWTVSAAADPAGANVDP